jgi:IstB-like ATP binding protein
MALSRRGHRQGHLAIALGVAAVRPGRSVYFAPLADFIDSLAPADREGRLRERIRYLYPLDIIGGRALKPSDDSAHCQLLLRGAEPIGPVTEVTGIGLLRGQIGNSGKSHVA